MDIDPRLTQIRNNWVLVNVFAKPLKLTCVAHTPIDKAFLPKRMSKTQ